MQEISAYSAVVVGEFVGDLKHKKESWCFELIYGKQWNARRLTWRDHDWETVKHPMEEPQQMDVSQHKLCGPHSKCAFIWWPSRWSALGWHPQDCPTLMFLAKGLGKSMWAQEKPWNEQRIFTVGMCLKHAVWHLLLAKNENRENIAWIMGQNLSLWKLSVCAWAQLSLEFVFLHMHGVQVQPNHMCRKVQMFCLVHSMKCPSQKEFTWPPCSLLLSQPWPQWLALWLPLPEWHGSCRAKKFFLHGSQWMLLSKSKKKANKNNGSSKTKSKMLVIAQNSICCEKEEEKRKILLQQRWINSNNKIFLFERREDRYLPLLPVSPSKSSQKKKRRCALHENYSISILRP